MSNSRRGTLAAILTAVVVGSVGVVSTLTAGAEQIPAPTDATTPAVQAPPGPAPAPPPRLPWGAKPARIQTGQDGATSRSLAARGLDAADPGPARDLGEPAGMQGEPAGKRAPKGRLSGSGALRSAPVPPKPPAAGRAVPPAAGRAVPAARAAGAVYYHYNVGSQAAATDGAYANFAIARPALATSDYHTLAELAVQSADGNQIVEVGWNVDRVVNGDADPHLFVFHWVNGQPTCYNGCGFVQYSQTVSPGDTLPEGATRRLGVQYYGGAWWIAYDTEWVGYFPDSLWGGTFTRSGMIQVFGEVASAGTAPCTEMGNGRPGAADAASARIGSVTYLNGPTVDMYVRSTSDHYDVARLSGRTFRYGGPGAC